MVKNHEISFLPQAPGRNMYAVRHDPSDLEPGDILDAQGSPIVCPHLGESALKKLAIFHSEYAATDNFPFEEIGGLVVGSRAELVLKAQRIFSLHAVYKVEDREKMRHASLAGCGVTVAFLDLIARMNVGIGAAVEFNQDQYSDSARKSLPTLMMIAATSREADGMLTENIMNWTPYQISRMEEKDVYTGLQFKEDFFEVTEEGAVELRSDNATLNRIRTAKGEKFTFSVCDDDILFGCPFRSRIPLFYNEMTKAMLANGLAEQSFGCAQNAGWRDTFNEI